MNRRPAALRLWILRHGQLLKRLFLILALVSRRHVASQPLPVIEVPATAVWPASNGPEHLLRTASVAKRRRLRTWSR